MADHFSPKERNIKEQNALKKEKEKAYSFFLILTEIARMGGTIANTGLLTNI